MLIARDIHTVIDEAYGYIRDQVAAGFASADQIIASVIEVFGDEVDPMVLRLHMGRFVHDMLSAHLAEQATWPATTDCNRLDAAFTYLEARGIICRHNFSCCGTCGAAEIWDEIATAQTAGHSTRGYVFYHTQDTEAAVDGHGLYLSYGAVDDGEAVALAIAREIVVALKRNGLLSVWDGKWSRRIGVSLDWKRRRAA